MWDMNEVTSIEYRRDYVFHVKFDDGLEAEVDLSDFVGAGPVFEGLRDPAFFRQARVEGGTITWPNGADIAPETLYQRAQTAMRIVRT